MLRRLRPGPCCVALAPNPLGGIEVCAVFRMAEMALAVGPMGSPRGSRLKGALVVILVAAALLAVAQAPARGEARLSIPTAPVASGTLAVQAATPAMGPQATTPGILVQRLWGGTYWDEAQSVTTDAAGNIYVAGYTSSYGPCSPSWGALSLLKYSGTGTLLMQKIWSNGSAVFAVSGIAVAPSGDIYVAGYTLYSPCVGGYWYAALWRFSASGNLMWGKTLPMTDSSFTGVALDAAGNAYVTGSFYGGAGLTDVLLAKFDPAGGLTWEKSWGGSSSDAGNAITVDGSGNLFVVGTTYSYSLSGSLAVLLKFDTAGNLLFRKLIGNGEETGIGVGLDAAGNIYVGGTTVAGSVLALLAKFDPTGGPQWQRSWGGSGGNTWATSLAVDPSGDAELVGYTNAYGAQGSCSYPTVCNDIAILRINGTGSLLSQFVYGASGTNEQADQVADSLGKMIVVGFVESAPPYAAASGNTTLAAPTLFISSGGNASTGSPGVPVAPITNGTSSAVTGNTSFAGGRDEFMLEFGTPPTVGFSTSPPVSGTITFNGTPYADGENASVPLGLTTAIGEPAPNYTFASWSTTGGVRVANASANTTQVTVVGSGTLTAHFVAAIPPTQGGSPGGVSPLVLGVAVAAILVVVGLVAVLVLARRRRRGGGGPPAGGVPPPT